MCHQHQFRNSHIEFCLKNALKWYTAQGDREKNNFLKNYSGCQHNWNIFLFTLKVKMTQNVSWWYYPKLGPSGVLILPPGHLAWAEKHSKKYKIFVFFNFWSVAPSKVCIYAKNHMLYETRGLGASLGINFGPKKWGTNSLYQFLSEHSRSCRSYQMQFFWRLLYSNQAPHLPKHFDIW